MPLLLVLAALGGLAIYFVRRRAEAEFPPTGPAAPTPGAPAPPTYRRPPVLVGPTDVASLFQRAQASHDPAEVAQIQARLAQQGAPEAGVVAQALSVFWNGVGAPKGQISTALASLASFPGLSDTLRVRRYLDIRYSPSLSPSLLPPADLVLAVAREQSDPGFLSQIAANLRWLPPPSGGPSMTTTERQTWGEVLGATQIYDAALACGNDRACVDEHVTLLRQRGFNRLAARF